MNPRRPRFLSAALFTLVCGTFAMMPSSATASPSGHEEAIALVQRTTDRLFEAMRAERSAIAADPTRVEPIVRDVVIPHVALEAVSGLVVGKHWRTATQAEKERFIAEFRTLLVRTYSGALAGAMDAKLEVVNSNSSDDGAQVQVRSRVEREDKPPIALAYRLTRDGGTWQVIDITIEGVSLVSTWRSEFTALAGRGGVAGLTDRIAERNARG